MPVKTYRTRPAFAAQNSNITHPEIVSKVRDQEEMVYNADMVRKEIESRMPFERFVQIHERLADLKKEDEAKLKALAELQQMYVSAAGDTQRDQVKAMVGNIREMSRATRAEIRQLNDEISLYMTVQEARELYDKLLETG